MDVEYLVIHHSESKDGRSHDWESIRTYHKLDNGWKDIGYHYGLEYVGDKLVLQKGRAEDVPGAHCRNAGMNQKSLGICLVGNFDVQIPTLEQLNALTILVRDLMAKYSIPAHKVIGHREAQEMELPKATKTCPGRLFNLDKFKSML